MKRRLLSLLLIAAMLVAIFPMSVSAATTTTASTSAQLYSALASGGNILLKGDIVLDSSFANTVNIKPGTVLDGNGYSLIYTSSRSVPLFNFAAGTSIGNATSYIKNIKFGTSNLPMIISGTTLFSETSAHTSNLIFQNVEFNVEGTNLTANESGALYGALLGVVHFYGCKLNANLSASSYLFGGWIGESRGELVMTNCTTTGTITNSGLNTAAFMGQAGTTNTRFTNCTNLADVTGNGHVAAGVANVGTGAHSLYFTSFVNYGNITSNGTAYDNMAGSLLGRATNGKYLDNQPGRMFYDCVNYGTITSGNRAGGFVGSSHDYDTGGQSDNYISYTFKNCINYGTVNGAAYAGGIIAIASPVTYRAELSNCVNVGKITSSGGYAGNFAGMLCNSVVTGGYAAGVLSSAKGTDVLAPHRLGTYTLQAGAHATAAWAITPPSVSGVKYIGPKATVTPGITKVTDADLAATLLEMSEACGVSFVKADSTDANSYVVAAEPIIRGLQQSHAVVDGRIDIRFAAGINAVEAFQKIGFDMVVHANGISIEVSKETTDVYSSLNATLINGMVSTITAASQGSKYLSAVTLTGVPATENVVIEVTPYTVDNNGTIYTGKTRIVSCYDGNYRLEPMVLNDKLLSDYAIVYSEMDMMSEELLAQRMSDEIAKLTGIVIPVFPESQGTTKTGKILIGDTDAAYNAGIFASGRTICTLDDPSSIVITGTNTPQLSESIEYFIEAIEDKILSGKCSWTIEEPVNVPVDQEVTMMAYNMGAKDDANIKKAEWNLIVDYLPDILTMQEPWAAFLDDFLNDYAVRPSTSFKASSNIDVMSTNVNNKAFTGNGYYGVYWGRPRWVSGNANTSGRASYSVILYAKDRFTPDLNRSGTFWLSNSPNTSGSVYTGSNFARCATYLTLTDKNTGKTFTVVNVHLDFDETVKCGQVNILLAQMKSRVGADMPIFITGDMNANEESSAIALYKSNSTMNMTPLDSIADHAYRQKSTIDWFFTNHPEQLEVTYYNNCSERPFYNNLWWTDLTMGMPSDHPAVYTEFKFK